MDKDGLRNLDCIVERERADEHRRGFVDGRQPMCELGARLHLDVSRQSAQHVIEQGNLLIGVAARAGRKQIGDPINDPEAMLGGRAGDRADQLIEERMAFDKRGSCVGRGAHCHGKFFATQ
jgi:hypothetical protein